MEMHQLRYFVAVARTGNFTRAAEQCHVSQPSLSQQIQKLEQELGEKLFDRTNRKAILTSHGEALVSRATRILEEVDAAVREASDAKALLKGVVSVGVLPTIAPYLLPRLLSTFGKKYPGVDVVIQEDLTANLIAQLLACEIDIAIASQPILDQRIETRHLFAEELLVALPVSHPLTKKRTISQSELEREPFIVMKEGHCLGDQINDYCTRRDLQANVRFHSAQLETIQSLVSAKLGVSLIPAMAATACLRDSLVYRSMQTPCPGRDILALWPKHRPPCRAPRHCLNWWHLFLPLLSRPSISFHSCRAAMSD